MSGIKKKQFITKAKEVPREKAIILEGFCNDEQIKIIKKLIKKGSTFICLGSEFSFTGEFYKGLMQLMYSPVYNGAACYDSHYKFRNAYDRPIITISLNDGHNKNKIDSIKLLDRYRTRTLYTYHYEELTK